MKVQYILFAAVFFASCGGAPSESTTPQPIEVVKTEADIVRENIETALADLLHNPDSYEFVDLGKEKTITLGENIQYRRDMFNGVLKSKNEAETAAFNAAFDSLEVAYADELDKVMATNWAIQYRATNQLGATVMNTAFAQISGDTKEVLKLVSERDKLSNNPGDIPNWVEVYQGIKAKFQ